MSSEICIRNLGKSSRRKCLENPEHILYMFSFLLPSLLLTFCTVYSAVTLRPPPPPLSLSLSILYCWFVFLLIFFSSSVGCYYIDQIIGKMKHHLWNCRKLDIVTKTDWFKRCIQLPCSASCSLWKLFFIIFNFSGAIFVTSPCSGSNNWRLVH